MATISNLCLEGVLERYEAELESYESKFRVILMTADFKQWFDGALMSIPKDRGVHVEPREQVEQVFHEFVIGKKLIYATDHKKLDPMLNHAWELKTADVRVFGWFPSRGHFIAVCGAPKRDLLTYDKYTPFVQQVVTVRDNLDLDTPKFLTGVRADEVL